MGKKLMDRNFQTLIVNGIRLQVVVEGKGPLVILLHGFPQCWYLWRHLIDPLVAAGYRVAVPDMRGYGGSEVPQDISSYHVRTLASDVAGIATALGEEKFVVIGHDFGCIAAWYTALLYPDRVRAIMGVSVPKWRWGPLDVNPPGSENKFSHFKHLQKWGVEKELNDNVREFLQRAFYSGSAAASFDTMKHQISQPSDASFIDVLRSGDISSFISKEDMDYYVEEFNKSGFYGPVSWYRNMLTMSSGTPELEGVKIAPPAAFVIGSLDPQMVAAYVGWEDAFAEGFEDLRFIEVIEGTGHWVPLEKPDEMQAAVLKFLKSVDG